VKQDVALTATGMPAIVLGGARYPLLFSIAAIKEWAEFKGMTFKEAIDKGWDGTDLDEDDLRCLTLVALKAGERRRLMFEGPPAHEISDELVDQLLEVMHRLELAVLLALTWNQPPRESQDPQMPLDNTQDGEPSST